MGRPPIVRKQRWVDEPQAWWKVSWVIAAAIAVGKAKGNRDRQTNDGDNEVACATHSAILFGCSMKSGRGGRVGLFAAAFQ
jgi:hypothetical protein